MRCPFCQTPALEDSPECGSCGFSLPKLDAVFGEPPVLSSRITDVDGLLEKADRKRLENSIDRFHRRFPQVGFHFWIGPVDAGTPLHLRMFWVFNRSKMPQKHSIGGINREVMLAIDSQNRRAAMVLGYGLEPFIGPRHLTETLEAAQAEFKEAFWRRGAQTVLEGLSDTLTKVHSSMKSTYGALPEELGVQAPGPKPGEY